MSDSEKKSSTEDLGSSRGSTTCEVSAWPQWPLRPRGDRGLREWLTAERKRLVGNVPSGQDPSRLAHAQAIRTIDEVIHALDEEHPAQA